MFAFASLLAFAASAVALQITQPSNSSGWTTSGPNTVTWSSVSTDNSNFSIVLNNQNIYPAYVEVLEALVQTSEGSITVNPPSGGWVASPGYRVNFVRDSNDLNSILAQSDNFAIEKTSSSTFSSGSSTASGSASSTGSVSVTRTSSSTSATDSSDSASSSSTSTASGSENSNAASGVRVPTGAFGLLAVLGVMLA